MPTESLPISALWKFAINSIIDENRAKKAHGRARKYHFQMSKNDRELYLAGLRYCLRKLTLPIIEATVASLPSSHKKESDMSSKEKKSHKESRDLLQDLNLDEAKSKLLSPLE